MRKGIMFTTDAILALIAVMLFVAWVPYQIGPQSGNQVFENLSEQARDKAITEFYKINPDDLITNETINPASEFGKCVAVYYIDPSGNIGFPAPVEKNVFCEEI